MTQRVNMNKKGKSKLSKSQKTVSIIISLFLVAGIVFFATKIGTEVKTTFSLTLDLRNAKEERDALLAEKEYLKQQSDKLSDPDYLATYARGEYLITKEGEQIYKFYATGE